MKNKEEKGKVGRPKLADAKLKKESILMCMFIFIVIAIIIILGYFILKEEFNSKYLVGTIYNTHIDSCIIEEEKLDCGPNVTYVKYKLDDGDYTEINKEYNSIEVNLGKYKNIDFCYKTDKSDLRCNK